MEPTFIAVSTQIVKNANISNTRTKRRFMYIDADTVAKDTAVLYIAIMYTAVMHTAVIYTVVN